MADIFYRVAPSGEELEAMIWVGAVDEFGETRQFCQAQHLLRTYVDSVEPGQAWIVPPPDLQHLPPIPLTEPTRHERLRSEIELFGFAVSGHPLELFDYVAWNTYCPVNRLAEHVGQKITTWGLIVEQAHTPPPGDRRADEVSVPCGLDRHHRDGDIRANIQELRTRNSSLLGA